MLCHRLDRNAEPEPSCQRTPIERTPGKLLSTDQREFDFNKTVAFSAVDSGMNGHTITYKAQDDHKSVFSGATKVKSQTSF